MLKKQFLPNIDILLYYNIPKIQSQQHFSIFTLLFLKSIPFFIYICIIFRQISRFFEKRAFSNNRQEAIPHKFCHVTKRQVKKEAISVRCRSVAKNHAKNWKAVRLSPEKTAFFILFDEKSGLFLVHFLVCGLALRGVRQPT